MSDNLGESRSVSSIEQDQAAEKQYQVLLKNNKTSILLIVDPKIRAEVNSNLTPISKSVDSARIPDEIKPVIIVVNKTFDSSMGKIFRLYIHINTLIVMLI